MAHPHVPEPGQPSATTAAGFLSVAEARRLGFTLCTAYDYPCEAAVSYLTRQKHRVEATLGLEAAIVQDTRGWVALWVAPA